MKVPYFTLRQLTYFVMAARVGKISSAAVELGISQSAITTAILGLEELLGAQLLERHPGGVTLTYRGQMFFMHAESILNDASDAQRAPFRGDVIVEGQLRVCATYVVGGYYLLPQIAKFRKFFPRIEISINEVSRAACEQMLIDGAIDLAVVLTSNLERADEIESVRLLHSRRQLWVSTDSPLLEQTEVSLVNIQRLPYCLLQVDDAEKVTRAYWTWYGLEPNVQFRTSSMEALRESIALGMGVTIVADLVYRPWSLDGRKIERINIRETVPQLEMGLAWKRCEEPSAASMLFRDFLLKNAAGAQPGVPG